MLAKIIRKNVKEALSIEMMSKLVPSWCRVTFYDSLKRHKTLKSAMQGKRCMIVLYQVHDKKKNVQNKAGHFIIINIGKGGVEYFSSSGWSVGQELAATHSDPTTFKRLLGKKYIENRVPLEKLGNSNDCWRFCLARAILVDMSLNDFVKLFQHHLHLQNADDIVTCLTMLHTEAVKRELGKAK